MTLFERAAGEYEDVHRKHLIAIWTPSLVAAFCLFMFLPTGGGSVLTAGACLVVLPLLLRRLLLRFSASFRRLVEREQALAERVREIRVKIHGIYSKFPARRKGETFKKAYALAGRSVRDLEEALSVGMFRERREVFVTAFVRQGIALRVTASIGSPFRCSAADNPNLWAGHLERLDCDELRQYHNHPVHNGVTQPSAVDVRSAGRIRDMLGGHAAKLKSLIICWNHGKEWKVYAYDEKGAYWLDHEFDAGKVP